ncbi:DNA mismatch repair protein [Chitinophaga polysaccharea]|uniref:MutS-related protein n=1 Tax=Chitinophaga TaxID=79328 RepID=UPI00145525F8|nr:MULTISPECIES: DNA mismatch repair protein [Chitinophaga]NLR58246.1 DNA mismatch repair protein [Chitinophaga polysaccharea]NLU90772.1 DNA mismatch repair protein [Chitinophaga sp. Ak27]
MSFNIDKQTVDELNLLGKYRNGSVYHLFNQVKTRGGEQVLDNIFRHPLEDAAAINERATIFRAFQEAQLAFPFDAPQLHLMREYLDGSAPRSAAVIMIDTLIKKVLATLTRDERYRRKVQGLQATIVTLKRCYSFLQTLPATTGQYTARVGAIRDILANNQVDKLMNIDIYQPLSVSTLAFYDHLLKGRLRDAMEQVLTFIYELDVNIAVSDVARTKGFTYATALPKGKNKLTVTGLRHPCLQGAVGNDLTMEENSNVLFLTGANMAGKSTLMKSVGIGLYLAHMGFPVAASTMSFSVREGICSSINVADNIHLGYSHFYAEVIRVKQAAEAAASGKRLLLMFDELFKGTNVKDAFDGTLAVTSAFAEYQDCLFIVSTHIIEVGEALKGNPNIRFAFLPTVMEGARPRYTYRLQEGITEDRQGMMIIRNEGILELIGS